MKIQPHHIDLVQRNVSTCISFHERTMIQIEMIRDHAWLNHLPIEQAAESWVQNGWAKLFADHYFSK
jgi:hypothetical protein